MGVSGALFWLGEGRWGIILVGWWWLEMSWRGWGRVGVGALFDNAFFVNIG